MVFWSNFEGARICCNIRKIKNGEAGKIKRDQKETGKRICCLLLSGSLGMLCICAVWSCTQDPADKNPDRNTGCAITVISREEGSGTRTAFVNQLGIRRGGHDRTTLHAEVTQSTAVVLLSVQQDRGAIGYVSAMTPREGVRTIRVNGILPSAAAVRAGSYPLRQEFYLVMGPREEGRQAAREFMLFVMSLRGQMITEQAGYVPMKAALSCAAVRESGSADRSVSGAGCRSALSKPARNRTAAEPVRLVIAGSTAMAPLIKLLAEAYQELHPEVSVELQQNGSAAGITAVLEGACDIGMSSRALTGTELARGIRAECVAADAVAVIVNQKNPVRDLSAETLRRIYSGEIRQWENIVNQR